MSDKIQIAAQTTGLSPEFLIWNQDGLVWNATISAFQAYSTANRALYEISMVEEGTASRHYVGTFDPLVPAGNYSVEIRDQAGEASSPIGVVNDLDWSGVGGDFIFLSTSGIVDGVWDEQTSLHAIAGSFGDGVHVAPDGLDAVNVTDPAGPPANFTERLAWMYALAAHKHTLTSTIFSVFAANDVTVITTQTVSNDGLTATVEKVA